MSNSRMTLFNAAMARAGHGKQLVEGDSAPEFTLLDRNYDLIVGSALEEGGFAFGNVRADLTTPITADFGYANGWLLPDNVLHVIEVFQDGRRFNGNWEVQERELYLDASSGVSVEYIRYGSEAEWSQKFAEAISLKLTALLVASISEEPEEAELWEQRAEMALAKAGAHSSRQRARTRPFRRGFLMRQRLYGRQGFRRRGDT